MLGACDRTRGDAFRVWVRVERLRRHPVCFLSVRCLGLFTSFMARAIARAVYCVNYQAVACGQLVQFKRFACWQRLRSHLGEAIPRIGAVPARALRY